MSDIISIIVPVYNMEDYIEECLDSIAVQTYSNIEIIVIDDGSTDLTGSICDRYIKKDSRFRVVHQDNKGLVEARKIGLSLATGKYVGFVDGDDWIDADMFEYLYQSIIMANADVVTSGRYIEENGESIITPDNIPSGIYHPLQDEFFCRHMIFGDHKTLWGITPNFWNKLFEKNRLALYEERVNNQITYGEDDACVYPYLLFSDTVCVTNRCFYHYRMRRSSMSKSADEKYFIRINLLYLCLKQSFDQHPMKNILKKELDLYMFEFAWRGVTRLWGIQSGIQIPHMWLDLSGQMEKERIVLYGASTVGQNYYQQFKLCGMADRIIWVDRDYEKYQKSGLPVNDRETVDWNNCDVVIVAALTSKTCESIKQDLLHMGVESEKIFWSRPKNLLSFAE